MVDNMTGYQSKKAMAQAKLEDDDDIQTYTRPWVGITDEEMESIFLQCGGKWNGDYWKIEDADFHPFLRTIETKLKKNT